MLGMETIRAIIDRLGGAASVARAVGIGVSTASEWKRANSVPVRYWPALIGHARSVGVALNADALMNAHQPARVNLPEVCSTQHMAD